MWIFEIALMDLWEFLVKPIIDRTTNDDSNGTYYAVNSLVSSRAHT
jgi:hypothetical protein